MGDRNNPIKFGPEWLRNLARERNAGSSTSNNQNTTSAVTNTSTTGTIVGAPGGTTANSNSLGSNTTNTASSLPKVQLAKLRYGREEMLALYDGNSQAPAELKYIELLYQPRGKPPVALNNTFEDEMRESMRTGPPIGGLSPGDRFGMGRGMGRGLGVSDTRGKARIPFVRSPSAGRGVSWHLGSPRMPGYGGGADDEASASLRPWNNSNGGNSTNRNNVDQPEWTSNKMFRNKRPGSNTNWRSPRDEDEWRSSDMSRLRPNQQEKWERDWGDRQDKPPSWNTNRRTWVGGDTQNSEDNLPEWAMDSAEACSGTFDSSGAFHGYSNDDSNLPKNQETAYPLIRSHTHGSFVRSKTVEEGSEEWWASEKAKKLSPKRFDASDIKFKKSSSVIPDVSAGTSSNTKVSTSIDNTQKGLDEPDASSTTSEPIDTGSGSIEESMNKKNVRFVESKTFDALMRSDIKLEEATDERGNFQSVMITPNNSLRQKHQNIVPSGNNNSNRPNRKPGFLHMLQNQSNQPSDSEHTKQHQTPQEKIIDDMIDLTLEDNTTAAGSPLINSSPASVLATTPNSMSQIAATGIQLRMSSPVHPNQALVMNQKLPTPNIPAPGIQNVGITNSALNATLGLPLGPVNNTIGPTMGLSIQGVPQPVLPNQGMPNPNVATGLQNSGSGIPGFATGASMPGMAAGGVANSSLFLQNTNNPVLQQSADISNQSNMYPLHGLQHSSSQAAFSSSIYSNLMQQSSNSQNSQSLADQWFYEDPKKNIQGPFSSKEMYNWYRAGFFSPSLMVRRACDALMRPLGSYGPVVPFAQMDMISSFSMNSGFESRNQGPHESMMANSQQGLGLDVMNMSNMNMSDTNTMDPMQFGTVGLMRNPPFGQQQMVESLWSQPTASPDVLWMQQAINARNEARVNNLPMFFWDQQPSTIAPNSLLPEEIAKEMKTEDQILAQLRASQNANTPQNLPYLNDTASVSVGKEDAFPANTNVTPNLEELQKLIQEDGSKVTERKLDNQEVQLSNEKQKCEENTSELTNAKLQVHPQSKGMTEPKTTRQTKSDLDKSTKNKENNITKSKSKKTKDEKKEDFAETKTKEDDIQKVDKRSEESSPTKNKKEDKLNKKELEREKKEWIKEGFTIVKGSEKSVNKDKKKTEESKANEESERKRKEEEKLLVEEEKKRKQLEALKKQESQQQQQQQRQTSESVMKKAPWSAVANQAMQATNKDGLTLAEIQRLERETKLQQMKEQQQMMQIIAQQQAAALAREQEMQSLGWAKKKGTNLNVPGQSLTEIQAEARKQAVASAAAAACAAQALEEAQSLSPPQMNHAPWASTQNGGGFWDTPNPTHKSQESPKIPDQTKNKKKITLNLPAKKETSPAAEFEIWCTTVLSSWSAKVDVPTFVGFLKDIESPYEVKDYVKCYLGESKDSNDFARQFLEKRSKLLRVGMVTPSDDLCSPAIAVNPRTTSGSDYQEVKGKGKKTKKNKMLKVDARILGFSVTASEDRINVGDIDTV